MSDEIATPKRAATVSITRKQFRGLCDALAHTVNTKHALLAVITDGHERSENALYAAQEKLQRVEQFLREAIK